MMSSLQSFVPLLADLKVPREPRPPLLTSSLALHVQPISRVAALLHRVFALLHLYHVAGNLTPMRNGILTRPAEGNLGRNSA
ncbi:hypothetical protein LZ32DRAFT_602983 [Colletotrichum eremochloae]|nr:hypothetical protein LZ32DRAFT_602983 [Colletotrichum eremochloae]